MSSEILESLLVKPLLAFLAQCQRVSACLVYCDSRRRQQKTSSCLYHEKGRRCMEPVSLVMFTRDRSWQMRSDCYGGEGEEDHEPGEAAPWDGGFSNLPNKSRGRSKLLCDLGSYPISSVSQEVVGWLLISPVTRE